MNQEKINIDFNYNNINIITHVMYSNFLKNTFLQLLFIILVQNFNIIYHLIFICVFMSM